MEHGRYKVSLRQLVVPNGLQNQVGFKKLMGSLPQAKSEHQTKIKDGNGLYTIRMLANKQEQENQKTVTLQPTMLSDLGKDH